MSLAELCDALPPDRLLENVQKPSVAVRRIQLKRFAEALGLSIASRLPRRVSRNRFVKHFLEGLTPKMRLATTDRHLGGGS